MRGCGDTCPLNVSLTLATKLQVWAAPEADSKVSCVCGDVLESKCFGMTKTITRHVSRVKAHRENRDAKEIRREILNAVFRTVATTETSARGRELPR